MGYMEKITEFRNTLAVPIHKLSIDSLVQEVCLCPEYFEDIYRLTYDEKQTVSWRAIWVCEKLSEIHPDWFILLYDEIIQRLIDCTHDGSKRLLLSNSHPYSNLRRFAELLPGPHAISARKHRSASPFHQNSLSALQEGAGTAAGIATDTRKYRA